MAPARYIEDAGAMLRRGRVGLAAKHRRRPARAPEDLVQQRGLDLAEALTAELGPQMRSPQATELHKMTVARRTLREYAPVTTLFPSAHIPTQRAKAEARLAERLEHAIAEF